MKNKFFYFGVLLLFISCETKKPALRFERSNINLGNISAGISKEYSAKVYNDGNDTLKLVACECSCECTNTNLKSAFNINPFDSSILKFTITPDQNDSGKIITSYCTIKSNTDSVFSHLQISYSVH